MQASRAPTQASPGRVADLVLAFVGVLAVACLLPAAVLAFFRVPVAVGFAVGIPVAAPVGAYAYAASVAWVDTPRYWAERGRRGAAVDALVLLAAGVATTTAAVAIGVAAGAPWVGVIVGLPLALAGDALAFGLLHPAYVDWPPAPSETR